MVKKKMTLTQKRRLAIDWIMLLLLCAVGVVFLLPLVWMVVVTFEGQANISPPFPPKLWTENPSLFNIQLVMEGGALWRAYGNSAFVAIFSVVVNLISCMFGGYALSKGRFWGKGLVTIVIMATMMVPFEVRMLPMFVMFNSLHLVNNFSTVIFPTMVDAFALLTARQYFDKMPDSLRESASIDGMGEFGIFLKIYLPLSGPVTATLGILAFLGSWNNFLWPLIILSDPEKQTIPLFISSFSMENATRQMGTTMAVSFMAIVPVLIVYLFLQKYIIQSVATSGMKE